MRAPCSLAISHSVGALIFPECISSWRSDCAFPSMNPYTPWRPGLTPVTALVHAGGVYVGTVDTNVPLAPCFFSAASLGIVPSSSIGSSRCHAAPSSPITTALFIEPS